MPSLKYENLLPFHPTMSTQNVNSMCGLVALLSLRGPRLNEPAVVTFSPVVVHYGTLCNIMARKEHFTLRLAPDTIRRLVQLAERQGQAKTALAERYLQEGVRMAEHPGIVFRDGPSGRRPGIAGRGLDVWEVVETVDNEGGDTMAAAEYLSISPQAVVTAVGYYLDYKDEVDRWIQRNEEIAQEAETAWRRSQDVLTA
ncbi:MAG: hypothetical protein ACR2JC_16140 [Chloroflexota bacterium]